MNTFAGAIKRHKLGTICRVGTWVLAIIGVVHLVTFFVEMRTLVATSGNLINYLPALFSGVSVYLFYGTVLYCASVIFEAIGARETSEPDQ